MRNGALSGILASVFFLGALLLGGCGGDDSARREVTWRASQRLPLTGTHWWWEPVERSCAEDTDCRTGERCQRMRLGTCSGCPRGEDHEICIPRDQSSAQARRP